ncbi:MAG: hypothetical protein ACO3A2_06035 [Bdellovibrionia bacterium]
MKLFIFYRKKDPSGVSGTGIVAEGVEFTNGWCALRWISSKPSLCFYSSLEDLRSIHGHGDFTQIQINPGPLSQPNQDRSFDPHARSSQQAPEAQSKTPRGSSSLLQECAHLIALAQKSKPNPKALEASLLRLRKKVASLRKKSQIR